MIAADHQDLARQHHLVGEDAPTWLAVGFAASGLMLALAAAWLAFGAPSLPLQQPRETPARSLPEQSLPSPPIAAVADTSETVGLNADDDLADTRPPEPTMMTGSGRVLEPEPAVAADRVVDEPVGQSAEPAQGTEARHLPQNPVDARPPSGATDSEDSLGLAAIALSPNTAGKGAEPDTTPAVAESAIASSSSPSDSRAAIAAAADPSSPGIAAASPPETEGQPVSDADPGEAQDCARPIEIPFELGSARPITDRLQPQLEALRAFVARHSQARLLVEGHTDSLGTESRNIVLSYRRAKAVASTLVAAGLDAARVDIRAAGSSSPIEGLPASSADNRRVVLEVLGINACQTGKSR